MADDDDDLVPDVITPDIDPADFARACLAAARTHGVSPHYLIAVAQHDTKIANIPSPDASSNAFGPFQITRDAWAATAVPMQFGMDERFDPTSQCFVTAKMTADANDALQAVLPDQQFPSGAELYCARILGVTAATGILGAGRDRGQSVKDALTAVLPSSDKVAAVMNANADLLTQNGQPRTISQVIDAIVAALDPGLKLALTLVDKVEPGLFAAPPLSGPDAAKAPWMALANQELAKNIREPSIEIDKYFSQTGLGEGHEGATAWCAAFVSWCIKTSTNKPLHYSALAKDWMLIGSAAPGPAVGLVAVTFPLVAKSTGHVGFVTQADDRRVMLLAGNQPPAGGGRDGVTIREYAIDKIRGFRSI